MQNHDHKRPASDARAASCNSGAQDLSKAHLHKCLLIELSQPVPPANRVTCASDKDADIPAAGCDPVLGGAGHSSGDDPAFECRSCGSGRQDRAAFVGKHDAGLAGFSWPDDGQAPPELCRAVDGAGTAARRAVSGLGRIDRYRCRGQDQRSVKDHQLRLRSRRSSRLGNAKQDRAGFAMISGACAVDPHGIIARRFAAPPANLVPKGALRPLRAAPVLPQRGGRHAQA